MTREVNFLKHPETGGMMILNEKYGKVWWGFVPAVELIQECLDHDEVVLWTEHGVLMGEVGAFMEGQFSNRMNVITRTRLAECMQGVV